MTPSIDQMEWFFKTGASYGLGFMLLASFTGILIYATWRICKSLITIIEEASVWIPKVIKSHIDFLQTTERTSIRVAEASEKTAQATETMSETHTQSQGNHRKTHAALGYIAAAQREGATCADVKKELDKAIDMLRTQ